MKRIALAVTMFFNLANVHGQSKFFNNDSIKYRIALQTRSADPNSETHYFVLIDISLAARNDFKKQPIDFWLPLLTDEKTDWASNLILYCIYKRDALKIKLFPDRGKWLPFKDQEISYWKNYFANSKSN